MITTTSLLLFAGLTSTQVLMLVICILAVCVFETINGFHDTANAVATVIYTKSLKPSQAVVWSGIWNFLGAMLGGIAVAMGIVKLIPLNDLAAEPLSENIALVLAILVTAIAWNLGTWYFGIPCSSSHTLIGALLGGGYAFFKVRGEVGVLWSSTDAGKGVNGEKALEIGSSLLLSPMVGFSMAIILMYILRTTIKKRKEIFNEPDPKKAPPIWIRAILILTCTLVSFFHGNNDGQKGVGLLLVVMMAFLPLQFALNPDMKVSDMKTQVASIGYTARAAAVTDQQHAGILKNIADNADKLTVGLDTMRTESKEQVFAVRKAIQKLNKEIDGAEKSGALSTPAAGGIIVVQKSLKKSYEFSPIWVVFLISLCLGVGTMVGWKRIVVTIGEKIGKNHLTYAQGACAEVCAATTIGLSSQFGLPVSTTHVLSSGIAGTMVAHGGVKNLQRKTIANIGLAWVLTLPVTFVVSALLYLLFRMF
jgi:inorganic phosphate transporter, PiT family